MKFVRPGLRAARGHVCAIAVCLLLMLHAAPSWAARKCPDGSTAGSGNICPDDPPADNTPPRDAAFVSQSVPTTMVVGQTYGASLAFKNTGTMTWTSGSAFNLGSQNPGDNSTWGTGRVGLPGATATGQTATFNFNATAPRTPGTYNFQWRMVQDGVAWFGNLSSNVSVQVLESVIKGNIDGIGGGSINGWACSTRLNTSIDVHLYVGGPAGGGGTMLGGFRASNASETGVASACQAGGSAYRFSIPITNAMVMQYGGQTIYVHGISPVGASNSAIAGSGNFRIPVNAVPTAQLTAPGGGAIIAEGGTFSLAANASDADDGVASVAFLGDGNVLLSTSSSPYQGTWSSVAEGAHSLAARATDTRGASTTSSAVTVYGSRVIGDIGQPDSYRIWGWACSTYWAGSIQVHLYVGGPYGTGTYAGEYSANKSSGTDVAAACKTQGSAYIFEIPLTDDLVRQHAGKSIYIHGLSPLGGGNNLIGHSGSYTVPQNQAPTAQLTAPSGGAIIAEGGSFSFAANASDPDGPVASVAFIGDGNVVATDSSAPYQGTWSSIAEGAHTVAARATDTRGASTTSGAVTVYASRVIGDMAQPDNHHVWGWACSTYVTSSITVHMYVGGAAGTGAFAGEYVANRASGQDVAGICKTQGTAYAFDIPFSDDLIRQQAGKSIYIHGLSPLGGGNNLISHSGSFAVPQNQLPSITLTAPTGSPRMAAPGSIQMSATASDADDAVVKVEFLSNDQVVGSSTSAPYQYTLTGLAAGTYNLRAVATDRRGGQTTTATVTAQVFGPASPASVTRSYVYDQYQRLCKTIEPESGATVVDYDAAGNVIWSASGLSLSSTTSCDRDQVPASAKVVRTYTVRNQVESVSFPDGIGNQVLTYTPDGLVEAIATNNSNGGGTVTNSYLYNHRRLMTLERLDAAGTATDYAYGYDSNGSLASNTWHGMTVDYAPNALGQPTKAGSFATDVSYWPNGAIKQFTYGNGIVHTMQQNARQLPERSTDALGDVRPLDSGYAYDANGNVKQITDYSAGGRRSVAMSYDGLDRLTYASSPMFGTAAYGYDALDNLISAQISGGNSARNYWYIYNAQNRLASITDGPGGATVVGLDYDARGNLSNKNGVLYSFDIGNQLRSVSGSRGAYLYDGKGLRVLDTVNGISKRTQYGSGGQLVYVSDARTNTVSDYIYLSGSLVSIREQSAGGGAFTNKYQHTDALGSPVAVTDQSRLVVDISEYEPYGKLANRGEKDGPGFTGHVQDAATGMTYMQQRYYDPSLGQFLSIDPVTAYSVISAFSRYRYANSNPYKFIDPDGRDAVWKQDKNGNVTLLIPVHFSGADASPSTLAAIEARVEGLAIDNAKYKIDLVISSDAKAKGVNRMDLSPGLDQKNYGDIGEGIESLGGNDAHIDSSKASFVDAAAHDILHFAGINDGYKDSKVNKNGTRGPAILLPGYDGKNIMASRNGIEIKSVNIDEAKKNRSTKKEIEK